MKYRDDMFELALILTIMLMATLVLLCYVNAFYSIGSFMGCVLSVIVPVGVMVELVDAIDEDNYYETQEIEG